MRRLVLFWGHYLNPCTLCAPVRVYDTFVQHHPIALGNGTGGSARAAAELECERNGVVQQVRSNSHEFHAGKAGGSAWRNLNVPKVQTWNWAACCYTLAVVAAR